MAPSSSHVALITNAAGDVGPSLAGQLAAFTTAPLNGRSGLQTGQYFSCNGGWST